MDQILKRINEAKATAIEANRKNNVTQSLYILLYSVIKNAIISEDLPDGYSLPPTRKLSDFLGVSRSTIIKSYELLRLEGYIDSKLGSGHPIKPQTKKELLIDSTKNEAHQYAELSTLGQSFTKNITLINSTDDKSIAFRPGLPPLDIFPVNQWKNLSNLYWRYIKSSSLSYSPSSGIDQLKKNITNYLNLVRGIKCDYRQIIVVSGSLQSNYLAGTALLDKGDTVVMENPTFPNVYSTFKGLGANIKAAKIDQEGIDLSDLEEIHPKLIHVTPSGHYPSSIRMSLKRRQSLLNYANRKGSFIIENDYEHEISNWKNKSDSLFELDNENRVIYMGTFNRLLHPSLRIGYMIVPPVLLPSIEAIMKHSHRFVSPSIQIVLNQFIEKRHLYFHNKKVAAVVQERKEVFENLFKHYFEDSLILQNQETSNLQLLAKINNGDSDQHLSALFNKQNIVTHRYSKCFVADQSQDIVPEQGLILGFASVRIPTIKKKLEQMAEIYRQR